VKDIVYNSVNVHVFTAPTIVYPLAILFQNILLYVVSLNDSDDRSSRMDKESEDGDVCLETESEVGFCYCLLLFTACY